MDRETEIYVKGTLPQYVTFIIIQIWLVEKALDLSIPTLCEAAIAIIIAIIGSGYFLRYIENWALDEDKLIWKGSIILITIHYAIKVIFRFNWTIPIITAAWVLIGAIATIRYKLRG